MPNIFELIKQGEEEKVIDLINNNSIYINLKDENEYTVLHYIMQMFYIETVKLFLDKGLNFIQKKRFRTHSIADCSILWSYYGRIEIAEMLIDRGASVDERARNGPTAIHFAAMMRNTDMIKLLIDKGANIDASP